MSIQQSLNQALGSATFLAQTNPYLIDKFQTNKQISGLQKRRESIDKTQSKIEESRKEWMGASDTEDAATALDKLHSISTGLDKEYYEVAQQLHNLKSTPETQELYKKAEDQIISPAFAESWGDEKRYADKRRQMAESKAYEAQVSTINSIQDQKQGFEERRNLLKNKGSLRQQLKEQGYSAKEIRQAYSNRKKGSEE